MRLKHEVLSAPARGRKRGRWEERSQAAAGRNGRYGRYGLCGGYRR